jgi:hypothetical protein
VGTLLIVSGGRKKNCFFSTSSFDEINPVICFPVVYEEEARFSSFQKKHKTYAVRC